MTNDMVEYSPEVDAEDIRDIPHLQPYEFKDQGGNVCIRGTQGSGKGVLAFLLIDRLISHYNYFWDDLTANYHFWERKPVYRFDGRIKHGTPPLGADILRAGVKIPGYCYKGNTDMRAFIRKVYRKSHGTYKRQIIAVDEIDQVYSHLDSMVDKEAQEDLLTLFQDKKLENYFIYTKHVGRGVNRLIRSATEISIKPYFDRRFDTLYGFVIDGFEMRSKLMIFHHASRAFPHYDRWEYIE